MEKCTCRGKIGAWKWSSPEKTSYWSSKHALGTDIWSLWNSPNYVVYQYTNIVLVVFPDPTLCEEKGLGHWSIFLVLRTITWLHVCHYKIMQIIMIAELAEPRISVNVPSPFPRVRGGVWEWDYRSFSSWEWSLGTRLDVDVVCPAGQIANAVLCMVQSHNHVCIQCTFLWLLQLNLAWGQGYI